jgi:hypothetical protein
MWKPTAERAKELRAWYKENLGLNRNDVSVTKQHEGCLRIEMKNPDLSVETKDKIWKAAKGHEDIRRDEYTGEILQGANDFVFVYGPDGRTYWPSKK